MWQKSLGIYPIRYNNKVELLKSGDSFFVKLLELINQANQVIHFQTYIFEPDETGKIIANSLIHAAQRGVKVYMVLDAYGSKNFTAHWQKQLTDNGIHLYLFSPLTIGTYLHMGMRLHHKIITIDHEFALVGGINISNHYSAVTSSKPWLDFALFTQGFVANDLTLICERILKTVSSTHFKSRIKNQTVKDHNKIILRVLQNNWLQAKFGISRQYKQQIRKSKHSITIFASYFIPSIALIQLLKKASNRGVKVNLVLGAFSDTKMVQHATKYFYLQMLKAGIEIYEWKGSVLHAKLALIDNNWISVGSYNLNHLSDFGSIECNLEIQDEDFCTNTQIQLQQIIDTGCAPVLLSNFEQQYNFARRFFNFMCYTLVRISMNMLFFLQGRNRIKKQKVI